MHFLLLASILAAVSFGQDTSEYSECSTLNEIVSGCTAHLGDMEKTSDFEIANLDDPIFLVQKLESICNHSMHLKMYYTCVYTNLTTCLNDANSTQVDKVPDTSRIAMGIVTMCQDYTEVNKSCVELHTKNFEDCVMETESKKGQPSVETCSVFGDLFDCTDELDMCEGADVIQAFFDSARPHHCEPVSAASQSVTAVAMLLVTLTFSLLITL
ncbi:uncharacterized protein [Littorina saxatilis]|uniref:uncharacterized protein n=1 Tax=Littorina saxatilis TaxID=31220 RepID=UPI0038B676DD